MGKLLPAVLLLGLGRGSQNHIHTFKLSFYDHSKSSFKGLDLYLRVSHSSDFLRGVLKPFSRTDLYFPCFYHHWANPKILSFITSTFTIQTLLGYNLKDYISIYLYSKTCIKHIKQYQSITSLVNTFIYLLLKGETIHYIAP